MNNFTVIEIIKKSDKETQAIYPMNDIIAAKSKMHNDFGASVKDETVLECFCLIIDNDTGAKIDKKYYGENEDGSSIRPRVYTHNDFSDDNIAPYDSERLAIGNYNTKIASAYSNPECKFALTIRLDSTGDYADFDLFIR